MRDSTIKLLDIYKKQEQLKQSVIGEIEVQVINPDADYTNDKGTLNQEQMCDDSVEKSDTFRGGTEFKLFNPSTIVLQEDDNQMMETIMFGAQTAKQFQNNSQKYQDDMKDSLICRQAQDAETSQVSDRRRQGYRSLCYALAGV